MLFLRKFYTRVCGKLAPAGKAYRITSWLVRRTTAYTLIYKWHNNETTRHRIDDYEACPVFVRIMVAEESRYSATVDERMSQWLR